MAKDFPSKQPAPQDVADNLFGPETSGVPTTGFTEAPLVPQDRGGAGPGVPANKKKIS
jgi:hypothetical protein